MNKKNDGRVVIPGLNIYTKCTSTDVKLKYSVMKTIAVNSRQGKEINKTED